MHELGILSAMVHTLEQIVKEEGITEIETLVLEVGELSGVVPRYLKECYPAAVYKTFMEHTALELITVPGLVKCRSCGEIFNAVSYDMSCPSCGGQDMELLCGNDILIKEIRCR